MCEGGREKFAYRYIAYLKNYLQRFKNLNMKGGVGC